MTLIDSTGRRCECALPEPDVGQLRELYRRMVIGRRFDTQASALSKQGRLAVYPSSLGQEACQVGVVAALRQQDWLFPTYRDSVALITRGIPPAQTLTLFRGDWHLGYDPRAHRVAPQCTPLATNALHAVGLAHAAKLKEEDCVSVVLLGDGATSEGDAHEALNVAGVWRSPVVFVVQNNGWAISVPVAKQTAAPTLATRGAGYGMPALLVDGNDVAAVRAAVAQAIAHAAAGDGPTLIEALTYRIGPHTNTDDPARYRADAEVTAWQAKDPLARVRSLLRAEAGLTSDAEAEIDAQAQAFAEQVRQSFATAATPDPLELFGHVLARPSAHLRAQADRLATELEEAAG